MKKDAYEAEEKSLPEHQEGNTTMKYYLTQTGREFIQEGEYTPDDEAAQARKRAKAKKKKKRRSMGEDTDLRRAFDTAYKETYKKTKGSHAEKADAAHAAGNKAHQEVLNNMKPLKYKGVKEAKSPTYYLTQVGLEFFHESSEDEANKQKLALQHLDLIAKGRKHSLHAKRLRDKYRELEGKTSKK